MTQTVVLLVCSVQNKLGMAVLQRSYIQAGVAAIHGTVCATFSCIALAMFRPFYLMLSLNMKSTAP